MTNIKKIVIWALVIVNLFFLGSFLLQMYRDNRLRAESHENLSAILQSNGIYINIKNIHENGFQTELVAARDRGIEEKIAQELLGQTEITEQGGIIVTYTGLDNDGMAVFRNGGEFEVTLPSGLYGVSSSAENTVKRLLRQLDIDYDSIKAESREDEETVVAVSAWNSEPIFNCRIVFVFKDGWLTEIGGRLAESIKTTSARIDMSSSATALISFLNDIRSEKHSCKHIYYVDTGYYLNSLGDSISAVWRIEADTGTFYVDAKTGAVEQAEGAVY